MTDADDFDIENDDEMVDDYYLVNRADRGYNGRFTVWTKHRYPADARRDPDEVWMRWTTGELRRTVDEIASLPVSDAIASITHLRRVTERLEFELVVYARACGWTWRDVAAALEVDVAAAHRRFTGADVRHRRRRMAS